MTEQERTDYIFAIEVLAAEDAAELEASEAAREGN